MTGYTTEEVARLLGLSPAQIRSYTRAGFLSPARDARGNLGFTFQDLVLLKAAKGLLAARIPADKIRGSLRRLKQQLPRGRALSELRITAEGHRVVARDEAIAWNPESGQLVLDFAVATLAQRAAPLARRRAGPSRARAGSPPRRRARQPGSTPRRGGPGRGGRDALSRRGGGPPRACDRVVQPGGRAGGSAAPQRRHQGLRAGDRGGPASRGRILQSGAAVRAGGETRGRLAQLIEIPTADRPVTEA